MNNVLNLDVTKNPVRQLRDMGYSVKVNHHRLYVDWTKVMEAMEKPTFKDVKVSFVEVPNNESENLSMALPRGGRTVVAITTPNGEEYISEAICSMEDQFCKREGVKKAIGRLIKFL